MYTIFSVGFHLKRHKYLIQFLLLYMSDKIEHKHIIRTWLAGQKSCTLVIPKDFAKVYGLDEPSDVVIEGKENGIMIKKIEGKNLP
jgi:hypothetical protein